MQNGTLWQIGSRTVWTPVPNLDLSVEVMYQSLQTAFGGLSGSATTYGTFEDKDWVSGMFRVQRNSSIPDHGLTSIKTPGAKSPGVLRQIPTDRLQIVSVSVQLTGQASSDLIELIRLERCAFAAKMRVARAVLGWSQSELASRAGLTQRAVHKLEKGDTEPRRMTARAMETIWREQGLEFEEAGDGGFRVAVRSALLDPPNSKPGKQRHSACAHPDATVPRQRTALYRS